jgi:hypothetical protein
MHIFEASLAAVTAASRQVSTTGSELAGKVDSLMTSAP